MTIYIIGLVLLITVGVLAFVRASRAPSPKAVRITGILMIVTGLAQGAYVVISFLLPVTAQSAEAYGMIDMFSSVIVEVLYGVLMTGTLITLMIVVLISKPASARRGHASGEPHAFGQARQVPRDQGQPGPGYGHHGRSPGRGYPVGPAHSGYDTGGQSGDDAGGGPG